VEHVAHNDYVAYTSLVSAIIDVLHRRDLEVSQARERWDRIWPASVRTPLDEGILEYFIADMSVRRVEKAMDVAARKVPNGGPNAASYLVGVLRNMRRQDLLAASRGTWIVSVACPNCEASGLMLGLKDGRPVLECLDCGALPRVIRGRLDP
jgi:Zn ribbon nucleic-acid-binding protein